MINYVHPARRPACNAPSLAEITEARFADLHAQGYGIARTATAAAFDALPYEPMPAPRPRVHPLLRALRVVGVCIVLLLMTVTADNADAAPSHCAEDAPCYAWSTMGNLTRGVVLTTAPSHCKRGHGYTAGCTTVVDAAQYCVLRKANMIDRKRTPSLRGDGVARVYGCDVRYFAQ